MGYGFGTFRKLFTITLFFCENILGEATTTIEIIDNNAIVMGDCLSILQQIAVIKPFTKEDVAKTLLHPKS